MAEQPTPAGIETVPPEDDEALLDRIDALRVLRADFPEEKCSSPSPGSPGSPPGSLVAASGCRRINRCGRCGTRSAPPKDESYDFAAYAIALTVLAWIVIPLAAWLLFRGSDVSGSANLAL